MSRTIKDFIRNPLLLIATMGHRELLNWMNDETYLKLIYRATMGKSLDLETPRRFNEKTQWLKLHDRNPVYTRMVDKYEVKKHVADQIGEKYIIPTLGVWDKFDDIDFDSLPNQFVLKCTHDSGGLVICKDKRKLDIKAAKKTINKSLKHNFYWGLREWPYKGVSRRIICEKLISDGASSDLKDYKVFLFNGKAHFIQVDIDRFTDHHRNFYSLNWEYVPFTTCYPTAPDKQIPKPKQLDELIEVSEKLAASVGNPSFVRIDMYILENTSQILFGEMTFYHGAGFEQFYPDEYDLTLGDLIHLPDFSIAKDEQ